MALRRTHTLVQGWSHLKSVEWLSSQQPSDIVSSLRPPGVGTAEKFQESTKTAPQKGVQIKKKVSVEEQLQLLHDQLRKHGNEIQQERERLQDFMKSIQLQLKGMEERSQVAVQEVKAKPVLAEEEAKKQELSSTPLRGATIAPEHSTSASLTFLTSSGHPRPPSNAEPLTHIQLAQVHDRLKKNLTLPEKELRSYNFHQLVQIIYYLKQHGNKQLVKEAAATLYYPLVARIVTHGHFLHTDLFLDLIRELLSWGVHDAVLPRYAVDAVQRRQRGNALPTMATICSMISLVCVRYNPLYNETLGSLFNQMSGALTPHTVQDLSPAHMKLLAELSMGPCLVGHVAPATRTHCLSVLLQCMKGRSSASLSMAALRWEIYSYLATGRDAEQSGG